MALHCSRCRSCRTYCRRGNNTGNYCDFCNRRFTHCHTHCTRNASCFSNNNIDIHCTAGRNGENRQLFRSFHARMVPYAWHIRLDEPFYLSCHTESLQSMVCSKAIAVFARMVSYSWSCFPLYNRSRSPILRFRPLWKKKHIRKLDFC